MDHRLFTMDCATSHFLSLVHVFTCLSAVAMALYSGRKEGLRAVMTLPPTVGLLPLLLGRGKPLIVFHSSRLSWFFRVRWLLEIGNPNLR